VPTLAEQRTQIAPLLHTGSPADAFAAYYALYHDPRRTALFVHHASDGRADGFLVRAQTGLDLFRPVVVVRADSDSTAIELIRSGLIPNRPYYLVAPMALTGAVNRAVAITDAEVLCVYRLDPARFNPQINVLVVANPTPEGLPRFETSANGAVQTAAGVNWQTPHFAEVYVFTEAAARGKGWGKAVVSALAAELIKHKRTPLYVVNEQNSASISLATSVGFVDTGAREYSGQAVLRQ